MYVVERYVCLEHYFQKADWDDEAQNWTLTVKDIDSGKIVTYTADILIKGTGILNKWKWPEIKGLNSFKGELIHTGGWDPEFDWTNNVALIGVGSSGIQPKAKRVFQYMRGKTWISLVGYAAEVGGGINREYTLEERREFAENLTKYLEHRYLVEGKQFWVESDTFMKEKLRQKPEIYDFLIPDFPPGCRRLTPGPGHLEALFIGAGIEEVTENGIIDTNGDFHEVDAIICATGFD
ncbi:hypothetical protein ACJZ2D_016981 [Fusarium nematophilum]